MSYNKIEYHTVGRNSTNFYDQEHNLVAMHIANQEDMQKVFKYFFEQGAKCMKDKHQGQRESFEDIYFKFNKMNFEEIDSKINPQKQIEVISAHVLTNGLRREHFFSPLYVLRTTEILKNF